MAHFLYIEDDNAELIDIINLCTDSCARDYANRENPGRWDRPYRGWNGAHEVEHTSWCANCGVVIPGIETDCHEQLNNVVVNRFLVDERELCTIHEPAHIIQLSRDDIRDDNDN